MVRKKKQLARCGWKMQYSNMLKWANRKNAYERYGEKARGACSVILLDALQLYISIHRATINSILRGWESDEKFDFVD